MSLIALILSLAISIAAPNATSMHGSPNGVLSGKSMGGARLPGGK